MNHEGVCRWAPATRGFLNIIKGWPLKWMCRLKKTEVCVMDKVRSSEGEQILSGELKEGDKEKKSSDSSNAVKLGQQSF